MIPDFSKIGWTAPAAALPDIEAGEWQTPEGIAIRRAYGEADLAGLPYLDSFPGLAPFIRGPYPTMYV